MACTIVNPHFFKCQVDLPSAGCQSKTNTNASRRSWLTMPPWRCSKVPLGVMFNHQIQVSDSEGVHGAASSSRDFSQKQHCSYWIFLSSANSRIAKNPKPAEASDDVDLFVLIKGTTDWLISHSNLSMNETFVAFSFLELEMYWNYFSCLRQKEEFATKKTTTL